MTTKRNAAAALVVEEASVESVTTRLVDCRLRVEAVVRGDGGVRTAAGVPDRELAALLPRSILAAGGDPAPQLLETIAAILKRTVVGRRVRVWEYRGQRYLTFLSWTSVRFRVGQVSRTRPWSRTRPAS